MSGIRGLQGVVRKTVDDELQVNIWEPRHMEQIVPALLVNLQRHSENDRCTHRNVPRARRALSHTETRLNSVGCLSCSESPAEQTEVCFRELLGRAAYGHINNAIKPVLM